MKHLGITLKDIFTQFSVIEVFRTKQSIYFSYEIKFRKVETILY